MIQPDICLLARQRPSPPGSFRGLEKVRVSRQECAEKCLGVSQGLGSCFRLRLPASEAVLICRNNDWRMPGKAKTGAGLNQKVRKSKQLGLSLKVRVEIAGSACRSPMNRLPALLMGSWKSVLSMSSSPSVCSAGPGCSNTTFEPWSLSGLCAQCSCFLQKVQKSRPAIPNYF